MVNYTLETGHETRTSEQADIKVKQVVVSAGEFLERLALVGELSHMDEREQVEPWLLFARCKK